MSVQHETKWIMWGEVTCENKWLIWGKYYIMSNKCEIKWIIWGKILCENKIIMGQIACENTCNKCGGNHVWNMNRGENDMKINDSEGEKHEEID